MNSKELRNLQEPFKTSLKARKVLLKLTYKKDALADLKFSLSHLIEEKPVEVYTIAVDLLRRPRKRLPKVVAEGIKEISLLAARNSLCDPLAFSDWTAMEYRDYHQLASYRLQCKVGSGKILFTGSFLESVGTKWVWYNTTCGVCLPGHERFVPVRPGELGITKCPPEWWVDYLEEVAVSVGDLPRGGPFENKSICNRTLQNLARLCPTCYKVAVKQLPIFESKLSSAITEILHEVRVFVD